MTAAGAGDFTGFGAGAFSFLRALARHNQREWFLANRARYERDVRAPLAALVEEVDALLATMAPEIVGDPRRSLFRIHRDVRFSVDKRPYKTTAAAWFPHVDSRRAAGGAAGGAATAHGGAGFYVEITADGGSLGGGIWMPPRATLARIRERIDDDGDTLDSLLHRAAVRRRFGEMPPEARLTRMPRGYPASHAHASLLRHQSFTLGRALTPAELGRADLPRLLARDYALLVPLVRWLNGAVGLRVATRR